MTPQDYRDNGLSREVEEYNYLHQTWLKCKNYKVITSGIYQLDNLLERVFGKPHDQDWRNYTKLEAMKEKVRSTTCLARAAV